jgi:histidyl-tRNA synthetase
MEVVTEGSAPAVRLEGAEKSKKAAKKKGSAAGDADEDRSNDPSIGVGSIAAGGRYDNLVEGFSGSKPVSCVGISFGVDRSE